MGTVENSLTVDNSIPHHNLPVLENPSYEYFFRNCMLVNKPCIIKNITSHWKSAKVWTNSNKPCFNNLMSAYGNSNVTIYKCNEKYFNSQNTFLMKFKDYLKYWQEFSVNNNLPVYYLKDWHLQNENASDNFYEVPIYFSSDWLNEYLISCQKDDYRFVYMGVAGSWTPFHQDVFSSYSWSANICGKKKWILFPPDEEKKLTDKLGNLPYDIKEIPDGVDHYVIIQQSGDAIFVPSGWYHQVWNLEDTISINHNWVNGCNIKIMWKALENSLFLVKREIADCEYMENYFPQCQLILKATFGIDFEGFFNFLAFIANKRLEAFLKMCPTELEGPGDKKYIFFELCSLKNVLEMFLNHEDIDKYAEMNEVRDDGINMLNRILKILNK